jgi:hypothetical protein
MSDQHSGGAVSESELSDVLSDLVRDKKLECVEGLYRRIKAPAK